ncbi:hypothetical protein Tco_1452815, partial [Tanacetum coccineum]
DRMERVATTASSLKAEQDNGSGLRCQDTILGDVDAQTRFEISSKQSNDPPLSRGYTLGSGEDSIKLFKLMELFNVDQLNLNASKLKINAIRLKLVQPVFVYAAKHTVSTAVQVPAAEVNPIIYTSCIEQFWATAKVQTVNGVRGTDCLPTATIFEELARMGAKSTAWNEFSSTMASLIICLATNQKFNLSKYHFDAMVKHLDGGVKFLMYPHFLQVFINQQLGDMSHHKKIFVNPFHTKKVFANMKRAEKDFSRRITPLFDTMMVQAFEEVGEDSDHPTDSNQIPIVDQPSTSSQPKQKQKSKRRQRKEAEVAHDETEHSVPTPSNDPLPSAKEIVDLKKRVQRLERKKKSRTTGLKRLKKVGMSRRVKSSEDQESLGDHEDASKQGRSIEDIDADAEVTLVNEAQERQDDDLMFDTGVLDDDDEVFVDVTTGEKDEQSTKIDDSTAGEAVTTAGVEGSVAPIIPTTVEETLA